MTPLARCGQVHCMPAPNRYPLSSSQIDAIATAADTSARSVRRYLGGASMHGTTMRRIERALRAAGLEAHVRTTQGTEAA